MAGFINTIIPQAGRALIMRAISGDTVMTLTKLQMGDGELGDGAGDVVTSLVNPLVDIDIQRYIRRDNYVIAQGQFSNTDLASGFYWREIGLWAKDDDGNEVLLGYSNAGILADYIASSGSSMITKVVAMGVAVSSSANVQAVVSTDLVNATLEDLYALEKIVNLINNTATYKYVFDFTIPVSVWTKVSDTDRYGWKAEVSNGNILQDHIPDVTLDSDSLVTAFEAGVSTTAETSDGKLYLWSQAKPTAEISGSCTLWGGSNGGTSTSGGGVVPIASYDRLGVVQISSGLNITEEGELSVSVATDEEVDAMLAEIYGEEGAEV